MDSILALEKVYDSLSKGASTLDFSPSDITEDCAAQVQEIVRERMSGKTTEGVISRALSCMNDANGLVYLGHISAGMGYWTYSIKAYEKALKVFEKLGDVKGAAQTHNNLGIVYADMGEWTKAIEFYKKSLETYEKLGDVHGAAQTYGNLGLVSAGMGEWNKAIELYQKSLETFEILGDVQGVAQTYCNLGPVYAGMGEWTKAIEFYEKSIETFEILGGVQDAARTYGNLGSVYYRMGERHKAIEFYQKSLETLEKLGDVHGAAQTYHNLGIVYDDMGRWHKAIEFYQKSLETKEKLGDIQGAAQTYHNLGIVYHGMGEWHKAIEFYQKSLETYEKLGDVHGKGITLSNLGKLHLVKNPHEPEEARKYLEESIKLLNKEARPDYPNTLSWLALCYHKLGSMKKAQAKRENDLRKKEELVSSAAVLFLDASKRYAEVAALPRVNIPYLSVYSHINMGLSYSVKNITERDERKALTLLDSAIKEFKGAVKFADKKDIVRLQGTISDHEAKRYIRLAAIEKDIKEQNRMLDKAIEELENAVKYFEMVGDEKQCDINTCNGCRHLFKGLMAFREGVKENNRKTISDSVYELREAKICYAGAENELGAKTVEILSRSFEYVEELIQSTEQKPVSIITNEFIKIIDELSSVGLQRIVKALTFDVSMNVKPPVESKRNINVRNVQGPVIISEGDMHTGGGDILSVHKESDSSMKNNEKLSMPDAAALAAFLGWVVGGVLLYYGYAQSNIVSVIIGILIFAFLLVMRLKKS
jgi:tetratricopeptide (TPR) repeat protein